MRASASGSRPQRLPAACDTARKALSAQMDASPGIAAVDAAARSHLDSCQDCRRWAATLSLGQQMLAVMQPVLPSSDVRRVMLEAAHRRRRLARTRRLLTLPTVGVVALVVLLMAGTVFSDSVPSIGRPGGGPDNGVTGNASVGSGSGTPTTAETAIDSSESLTADGVLVDPVGGEATPDDCWSGVSFFTEIDDTRPDALQVWFLLRFIDDACPKPSAARVALADGTGELLDLPVNDVSLPMVGNPLGIMGHATWSNWCGEADGVQLTLTLESDDMGMASGQTLAGDPPTCIDATQPTALVADPAPQMDAWPLSGVGIGSLQACDLSTMTLDVLVLQGGGETGTMQVLVTPRLADATGQPSTSATNPEDLAAPCLMPAAAAQVTLQDANGSVLGVEGNDIQVTLGGVNAMALPANVPFTWTWSNWCSTQRDGVEVAVTLDDQTTFAAIDAPDCIDDTQPSTLTAESMVDGGAVEPAVISCGTDTRTGTETSPRQRPRNWFSDAEHRHRYGTGATETLVQRNDRAAQATVVACDDNSPQEEDASSVGRTG